MEGAGERRICGQSHALLWGKDTRRPSVPFEVDAERSLPNARRHESGCAKGKPEQLEAWTPIK